MKRLKIFPLFCFLVQINLIGTILNYSGDSAKFILQNSDSNLIIKGLGDYDSMDDGLVDNLNRLSLEECSTSTLVLDSDIVLNSNNLISTSKTIRGNNHSIILNSDWSVAALSTLKITTTLTIEGNGHTLLLDNFAQILTDSHATLSLHNLILKNTNNNSGRPPLAGNGYDSIISLNNVKIDFKNNFWFNKGNLFIANNVDYRENTQFIFNSNKPCYILPQSNFNFEKDSAFYYLSDDVSNSSVIFQDPSSALSLDGATLQSTTTGLWLDNGQLLLNNKSSLKGGVELNSGLANINSIKYGTSVYCVVWSPDGNYLAIAGEGPASGAGGFDNVDEVRIYRFDGKTFELTPATSVGYGAKVYTLAWSPDGKYLVVGGQGAIAGGGFSNTDELRLYSFSVATETLQPITSQPYGTVIKGIDWTQNDNYIAVGGDGATSGGGFDNTNRLRVYYFSISTNTLAPIASIDSAYGNIIETLKWRPSGNYIATGEDNSLYVYYFNPFYSNIEDRLSMVGNDYSSPFYNTYKSITWTSNGQYIVTAGEQSLYNAKIIIFNFDPTIPFDPYSDINSVSYNSSSLFPEVGVYSAKLDSSNNYISGAGINRPEVYATVYSFSPENSDEYLRLNCASNELVENDYASNLLTSDWNPKSNVIAYGGNNLQSKEVQLYNFIGENTELLASDNYSASINTYFTGLYTIDWSYDGNFIAIGGVDARPNKSFPSYDKVRIYKFNNNTETINSVASVTGTAYTDNKAIRSVKWSPDGRFLAIGGGSSIYSPASGNYPLEIYAFDGNQLTLVSSYLVGGNINSIDWHPSGIYLAIGVILKTTGQSVQILSFDESTLTEVTTYSGTSYGCQFVSWDPTGNYLGIIERNSGTNQTILSVFKFQNNTSLTLSAQKTISFNVSFLVPENPNLSWAPDSKYISVPTATSSSYGATEVFRFSGTSLDLTYKNEDYRVPFYTIFSPDGKTLVTCRDYGYLDFARVNATNMVHVTKTSIRQSVTTQTASWSPNGNYLAVGTTKNSTGAEDYYGPDLFIYKINKLAAIYNSYSSGINLSKYLDTTILGAANIQIDGIVNSSPKIKKNLTLVGSPFDLNYMNAQSVAWSPANNYIAVTGQNTTLKVFSVENPDSPVQIGSDIVTGTGYSVSWAPGGSFISLLNSGALEIYLFNGSSTPTLVASTTPASAPIASAWSPAGNFIAVACNDNTLKIFEFDGVSTLTQVGSDASTGSGPTFVSWTKDGNFVLVVNLYDNTLQVFSFDGINTPTQIGSNVTTGSYPICASWSPSGNFIAVLNSNSSDMQIFSFDGVSTPVQVGSNVPLANDASTEPIALAWSPTENFIAVACGSGSTVITENILQIFSFDGINTPIVYAGTSSLKIYPCYQFGISWNSDGNFITLAGQRYNSVLQQLLIFSFE